MAEESSGAGDSAGKALASTLMVRLLVTWSAGTLYSPVCSLGASSVSVPLTTVFTESTSKSVSAWAVNVSSLFKGALKDARGALRSWSRHLMYACAKSKPITATPGSAIGRSLEGAIVLPWTGAAGVSTGAVVSGSLVCADSAASPSAASLGVSAACVAGASDGASPSAAFAKDDRLLKENAITTAMKTASALPSNVFFASQSFSNMLIRITESSRVRLCGGTHPLGYSQ